MSVSTYTVTAANGSTPISVQADNLMRRVLRINDPSNPVEVAQGLSRAYPLESAELDEEIQGLPIGLPAPAIPLQVAPSMAGRELVQAQSNIQRDLDFLAGSSQLKEVQVELQSWGETINTWVADGAAATTQALDSNARDRVFSARRILLDYARVARLVGALTPGLSIPYRRFARSLDETSGILIVSLGEALAQIGFSGDRLLLQAPVSELSARAEAAAAALRNLTGSVNDAFDQSSWPWGLDGYRKLLRELESAGHGDVRVLLTENGLRAFTDELINRASSLSGDGLRALAATHVIALERVKRLIQVGTPFSNASPPLASFITALELFVLTFEGGNAGRLIALGRPLLAAANLYYIGGLDAGTQTLLRLVRLRSQIAQLNDSLFGTDLTQADAQAQFAADSCLYALDLAIDLYAVGISPDGQGRIERRAAAYGLFIWQLLAQLQRGGFEPGLTSLLNAVNPARTNPLLPSGLPPGGSWPLTQVPSKGTPTLALLEDALTQAISALGLPHIMQPIYIVPATPIPPVPPVGMNLSASLEDQSLLKSELETLRTRHSGIRVLVNAVTPGNFDTRLVMQLVDQALDHAIGLLHGPPQARLQVPPPLEATLIKGIRTLEPPGAPSVASVTPSEGPATGGTLVTIRGNGFTGATGVAFGSTLSTAVPAANVTAHSDTLITAETPPGDGGTIDVFVTTQFGTPVTSATGRIFDYLPTIKALDPPGGPEGGNFLVTILGSGFTGLTDVTFDGISLPPGQTNFSSDQKLVVNCPPGTGKIDVAVTTATGTSSFCCFTYNPGPRITGISAGTPSGTPPAGSTTGGTLVTITGTNLAGAFGVKFGRTIVKEPANLKVEDSTILVSSPSHTAGRVEVKVVTPQGEWPAPEQFEFQP